ncbi:hypothetical protein HATV-3_gp22 [Haloarcula tailed virus 3]|uniref:Uncharacterized protein n=1 Tax=Haloarcula tailed virus 3 TaxID=2877990 RepID=A0AAE8XZ25_9CAUD|nr:hypothetical protein M1M35_gp22 [Haloarcula tailed virus 3]UBF23372.1 hypothetical protein HATV-3_gp22 [Haloarcula tailed virus 3]
MNIQEIILQNPLYLGILTVAILLVYGYQHSLSFREYYTLNTVKGIVFTILNPYLSAKGRPLLSVKGSIQDSDEYVVTEKKPLRRVYAMLRANGFTPHLIATTKVREGERADAQLVYVHDDGKQTEAYLFASDGKVDIYAHVETAVFDPDGHLTDNQQAGDTRGKVLEAIAE